MANETLKLKLFYAYRTPSAHTFFFILGHWITATEEYGLKYVGKTSG